jgi:hypothetical protein
MSTAANIITPDAKSLAPPTLNSRVQCTNFQLNNISSSYNMGTSTSVYDASNCMTAVTTKDGGNAAVVFAGMTGAGDLGVQCPADHPYYHSFSEVWVIVGGNGGAGVSASCCTVPPNRVSSSTSWQNASADAAGLGACNQ